MLTKYKLGELIDVTRGMSLPGEYYSETGEYIRLTMGNFNYTGGGFKENTSKSDIYYVGPVRDEYVLSKGDIITPLTEQAIGLLGTTAMIPESGKYIQSQDVALIKCKEDKIDHLFCYYLVSSDIVKKQLSAAAQQTKIRHTSPDKIMGCTVWIPEMSLQQKIGKTLYDIDQKIALNTRMNAELEAMAKQLYDYWFVQFDFPDENGNPYKSSGGKMVYNPTLKREIPAGWNASNICIVSQILSGGTPSKAVKQYWENGNIPFFGPTDYEGYVFQMRTADHITERGLNNCASSLFEEGDIIITARGSIGKLVIVGVPMAMNQSCYALRPKNNQYEYLFFLTKQLIEYLKIKGNGSVFKSIIASDIEDSIMCIATDNVIYAYCEKVSPLFLLMKKNTEEIINLTHLRDSLLPMLMNGQVTVEK